MIDNLKLVLSSPSGRAFIYEVLVLTGYFTDTFNNDTIKTTYNCGRRAVGVNLVDRMKHIDFENYLQMLREHEDGSKNNTDN